MLDDSGVSLPGSFKHRRINQIFVGFDPLQELTRPTDHDLNKLFYLQIIDRSSIEHLHNIYGSSTDHLLISYRSSADHDLDHL